MVGDEKLVLVLEEVEEEDMSLLVLEEVNMHQSCQEYVVENSTMVD